MPGVAAAEGSVSGEAQLIGSNGKAIVFGGAPNLGFSVSPQDSRFSALTLVSGSWPHGREVVIDRATANKKHLKVGQEIGVQAEGPIQQPPHLRAREVRLGLDARRRHACGLRPADGTAALRQAGRFDEIAVAAASSASKPKVLRELRSILPANAQVRTGEQQAAEGRPGHRTASSRSCEASCWRSAASPCSSAAS